MTHRTRAAILRSLNIRRVKEERLALLHQRNAGIDIAGLIRKVHWDAICLLLELLRLDDYARGRKMN